MSAQRAKFFRHDAFISYAHADNCEGAVRAFHAQLEEFLSSYLEWEPSLWLDERVLDVADDLERQIRDGLRDAAILIVVGSETITSREWCRNEMGWFLNGAQLDRVGTSRMFPVFLPFEDTARLPPWAHLDTLRDFFILDPARGELIANQDYATHRRYWDRLYGYFTRVADGIVRAHIAGGILAGEFDSTDFPREFPSG
jgi:hypothetical protein